MSKQMAETTGELKRTAAVHDMLWNCIITIGA
jgi:hypothetical protein